MRSFGVLGFGALGAMLLSSQPAHATPPTISEFTAQLSETNLVTLTWRTQGGDSSGLLYVYDMENPLNPALGFKAQNGPNGAVATASFRVGGGGRNRYVLAINNDALERATANAQLDVPYPTIPTVTSVNPAYVDIFHATTPVTITWTQPAGGVGRVNSGFWLLQESSCTSCSYTIQNPSQQLTPGTNGFSIAFCKTTADPNTPLCSEPAAATVVMGGSRFTGNFRRQVPYNVAQGVSWSAGPAGTSYVLHSAALGIQVTTSATSYTIPKAKLAVPPGAYDIDLATCFGGVCTGQYTATSTAAGTVTSVAAPNTVLFVGDTVAQLSTATGPVTVTATRQGLVAQVLAPVGTVVANGAPLVTVTTDDVEHQEFIVGWPTQWTSRQYTNDFVWSASLDRVPVYMDYNAGAPLDVVYGASGDFWSIGEFSQGLVHSVGSALAATDVPLPRTYDANLHLWLKVAPFTTPFGTKAPVTELGEKILQTPDGKIWFTQGGDQFAGTTGNHSRIVSYDPSGFDDPATEDDDRFCAYNVPGDDNEVIGLSWDGTRMWFPETANPAMTWFVPSQFWCGNYLDPGTTPSGPYCQNPGDSGCFHKAPLTGSTLPAHVAADTQANAVWFTDMFGSALGRYDMTTGAVDMFPTGPAAHTDLASRILGPSPWQIRLDSHYVYFNWYGDSVLVRFDKTQSIATCKTVDAKGKSQCMNTIPVPLISSSSNIHSIDLSGNRLWFTIADTGTNASASQVGYVDTTTWQAGVLYTMLNGLVDTGRGRIATANFDGISVAPNGAVLFGDYSRKQLLRLWPKNLPR